MSVVYCSSDRSQQFELVFKCYVLVSNWIDSRSLPGFGAGGPEVGCSDRLRRKFVVSSRPSWTAMLMCASLMHTMLLRTFGFPGLHTRCAQSDGQDFVEKMIDSK